MSFIKNLIIILSQPSEKLESQALVAVWISLSIFIIVAFTFAIN